MPKRTKTKRRVRKLPKRESKQVPLLKVPTTNTKVVRAPNPRRGISSAYAAAYPKTYATIGSYNDAKNHIRDGAIIKFGGPILVASSTAAGGVTLSWGQYNTLYSQSPTLLSAAGFELNPHTILPYGSVAQAALGYARFMFKKLKFTFVGLINTATNGGFAMQFTPDGAAIRSDFGVYSEYARSQSHMYVQGWNTQTFDVTPFLNCKDMYYVDWDNNGTDAGLRQSFQGIMTMQPNSTVTAQQGQFDWGLLYAEGELLLAEQIMFNSDYAALPPIAPSGLQNRGKVLSSEEPVVVDKPSTKRSESKRRS